MSLGSVLESEITCVQQIYVWWYNEKIKIITYGFFLSSLLEWYECELGSAFRVCWDWGDA